MVGSEAPDWRSRAGEVVAFEPAKERRAFVKKAVPPPRPAPSRVSSLTASLAAGSRDASRGDKDPRLSSAGSSEEGEADRSTLATTPSCDDGVAPSLLESEGPAVHDA